MLSADERQVLEHDFAEAEASVRLEGLTPSANFFAVKARVLAAKLPSNKGAKTSSPSTGQRIPPWHEPVSERPILLSRHRHSSQSCGNPGS